MLAKVKHRNHTLKKASTKMKRSNGGLNVKCGLIVEPMISEKGQLKVLNIDWTHMDINSGTKALYSCDSPFCGLFNCFLSLVYLRTHHKHNTTCLFSNIFFFQFQLGNIM